MEVKAQLKNARMSPRKLRWLRDSIIHLPVSEARSQLTWQTGKAAQILLAVLNSAVANAKHNFDLAQENLKVSRLEVNEGTVIKRWQPASRGVAHPFQKRTANILIGVDEIQAAQKERGGKKSDIDTVSVADLAKQEAELSEEIEDDAGKEVAPSENLTGDKKQQAYQKKKMQQQGGDRKKTHRRKSM